MQVAEAKPPLLPGASSTASTSQTLGSLIPSKALFGDSISDECQTHKTSNKKVPSLLEMVLDPNQDTELAHAVMPPWPAGNPTGTLTQGSQSQVSKWGALMSSWFNTPSLIQLHQLILLPLKGRDQSSHTPITELEWILPTCPRGHLKVSTSVI